MPGFVLVVGLSAWSLWRVPVPAVNEPHYLGKARHFWDPSWCGGDLFLDSANPHFVFYATVGWLTSVLPLPVVAVVGRVLGLVCVAFGWQCLAASLTGRKWAGPASLPIFLLLQALGNWSGEWLVGGVEGKVFSYGFLFFALGGLLDGRLAAAGLGFGLAVSFHPVVGAWGVVCAALATIGCLLLGQVVLNPCCLPSVRGRWWSWGLGGALFLLTALPGLTHALKTIGGADRQTSLTATQLQVAHRLAHHLDPMAFPKESYRYFALLLVIWWLLRRQQSETPRRRWWTLFLLAALFVALAGVLLGWGPRPIRLMPGYEWRMSLLKFYPFRLADLLVPLAVSLAAADLWLNWLHSWTDNSDLHPLDEDYDRRKAQGVPRRSRQQAAAGMILAVLYFASLAIPGGDRNPSRLTGSQREAWIAACRYLRDETKPQSLVLAADTNWALKWFAERPEYVNYKDIPQDSARIVEWNRRLWLVAAWKRDALADGVVTKLELDQLASATGVRYLLAERFGPIDAPRLFENRYYRIYELGGPDEE